MRNRCTIRLLCLAFVTGFSWNALHGLTQWDDGQTIASNVIDDNLEIGANTPGTISINEDPVNSGTIQVAAQNQDITVDVLNGTSTIQNDSDNERSLHFQASAGRKITMNLSQSLNFAPSGGNSNFVVTFQGEGSFEIVMSDDRILSIDGNTDVGAHFLVSMDGGNVKISRQNSNSNSDVTLRVGPNGYFGFMSSANDFNSGNGSVEFNPSNAVGQNGRMAVVVEDQGSFSVQGIKNNAGNNDELVFSDLDFSTLTGARAQIEVVSNTPNQQFASLAVGNQNQTLPKQLHRQPFGSLATVSVGKEPGFIVGRNGRIALNDGTYFDYVGVALDKEPNVPDPAADADLQATLDGLAVNGVAPSPTQVFKDRNPSALIVDGPSNPYDGDPTAEFIFFGSSKMYFRSGVDSNGAMGAPDQFFVDANKQLTGNRGYGSIVLDVEGPLSLLGTGGNHAINILSQHEENTGGSALINGSEGVFKQRVFDDSQYGKAAFMVNNRMVLKRVALQHTDTLHTVFDKNRGQRPEQESEPTYIGGESFTLGVDDPVFRPTIVLDESDLLLHTSAAFTGVDLLTREMNITAPDQEPTSRVIFHHNGYKRDKGTGRSLVLGTNIGALASDLNTVVDRAAHFDVRQIFAPGGTDFDPKINARITTAPNNNKVTKDAPANSADIADELSVHSFFLGHNTNISLGTLGETDTDAKTQNTFTPEFQAPLLVDGNFISFETQGGELERPASSPVSGQGGIFVDKNGLFEIGNGVRANIAAMIGTDFGGTVDISPEQVTFADRVGLTNALLDLNEAGQRLLVAADGHAHDYVLNWKYADRHDSFTPYTPAAVPAVCQPRAVPNGIEDQIPRVEGRVRQFQVLNTRLGDPFHLHVKGGRIEELRDLTSEESGSAPNGVLVLSDNADVGLGVGRSASDARNRVRYLLGTNGLSTILSGSAEIHLNDDIVVDGTNQFALSGSAPSDTTLTITSEKPRELRVRKGSTLDFSAFANEPATNKKVVIGGKVRVVMEPGSQLALPNGGQLNFTDDAELVCQRFEGDLGNGNDLTATDPYRVRIGGGPATIQLSDRSAVRVPRGAYLGVESLGQVVVQDNVGQDTSDTTVQSCGYTTNITMQLNDSSQFLVGDDEVFGGAFQVGNTRDESGNNANVEFTLTVDGRNARFNNGIQGFLGLGVGIQQKPDGAPDTWSVKPTFNVSAIDINLTSGIFSHNNIAASDSERAHLIALSEDQNIDYSFSDGGSLSIGNALLRGGGNIVRVDAAGAPPQVHGDQSGDTGILSSTLALIDSGNPAPVFPTNTASIFGYLRAESDADVPTAQISLNGRGNLVVGYLEGTNILREEVRGIRGAGVAFVSSRRSLEVGSVGRGTDEQGGIAVSSVVNG